MYEKTRAVISELYWTRLKEVDDTEETLDYDNFSGKQWTLICTNNVIEHLNHEICKRARVVNTFPDGGSALMPIYFHLRLIAGNRQRMNTKHLETSLTDLSIA